MTWKTSNSEVKRGSNGNRVVRVQHNTSNRKYLFTCIVYKNNAHDNLFHKSNNKYIEWET
jgi:hypothetical protein